MSTESTASPRIVRKRERARARILAAAREVVLRDGYEGLTMEAVAVEADVSKASLYYYFANKESVVRGLAVEWAVEGVDAALAAIEGSPPGRAAVEALVRAWVGHQVGSLALFRVEFLWAQTISSNADGATEVDEAMVRMFDALEQRIAADADRGLVHEGVHPRRAGLTVWNTMLGVVSTVSLLDLANTTFLHDVEDVVAETCAVLGRGIYSE